MTYPTLTDLLNACSLPIYADGSLSGSAFFVAPGLLLTCAHVIETAKDNPERLTLHWQGQLYPIQAILSYFPKPYPDLALLEVELPDHPCVLLGEEADPGDKLYSFGHTEKYHQGDSGTFTLEGQRIETGFQTWLKFKAGQVIPGFSGAPLLNLATGAVCGMISESKDKFSALGGHALPLEVITQFLPDLAEQNCAFHLAHPQWAELQNDYLSERQNLLGIDRKIDQLAEAVTRLSQGQANEQELALLRQARETGSLNIPSNQVTVGGSVQGSIVIGDRNMIVTLTPDALRILLQEQYTPLPLPPPEVLPDPSDPPPGSRMIFSANAAFTGRRKELHDLAQALFYTEKPAYQAVVVSGIGGSGKSQLAVELAYRYGPYLDGVHWLNAASGGLEPDIVDCGLRMRVQPWPDKQPEQVAATLKAWVDGVPKGARRLVVLDNLEEPALLREWLPRLNGLGVLITARREKWPKDLEISLQPLDVLSRLDSLTLLRKLAPELENTPDIDLDPVAARFGDLPLGLQLAGAYIRELELSPAEYLARLERKGGALTQESLPEDLQDNPLGRELNLQRTFALSWDRLDTNKPIDATAAGTFRAAGYCAANIPIPESVLLGALGETADADDFKFGLARLYGLGLLTDTPAGPLLHPLLAEFARLQDAAAPKSSLPALVDSLAAASQRAGDIGAVSGYLPLLPHLRQAGENCLPSNPEQAALMKSWSGSLLQAMGDYPAARPYLERALAIYRDVLGEKHSSTATSLSNLGSLLQSIGDYPAARPYFEQALAIHREVLGENHPNVATDLNNLGSLLQAMGDYLAALPYYEHALAISKRVLGEKHLDTAMSYGNLGSLLGAMGEFGAARPNLENALAIHEEILDDNHPYIATSLNNLGGLLDSMGDYPAARHYYEQALSILKKVLGERHPDSATSLTNLGSLLQAMGDYPAARPYLDRALSIRKEILGENHPDTANSLINLGSLLQAMGDYLAARPYLEQALAIRHEVLGELHPDTASSLTSLGSLLQAMGDYPAARPYYEQALAINREYLGENHPETASSLNNLGSLLQDMGDYPAARPYYEQALTIRREVLGEKHPDTALSLNNLGGLLYAMGDYPAARIYFEQALAIFASTLPPNHPNVQGARDNLTFLDEQLNANR